MHMLRSQGLWENERTLSMHAYSIHRMPSWKAGTTLMARLDSGRRLDYPGAPTQVLRDALLETCISLPMLKYEGFEILRRNSISNCSPVHPTSRSFVTVRLHLARRTVVLILSIDLFYIKRTFRPAYIYRLSLSSSRVYLDFEIVSSCAAYIDKQLTRFL